MGCNTVHMFMLAILFANVYKTRLLCARTLRNHIVNTDCRTLYHNTIEVIEHTIEERNNSIIN